MSEPDKRLQRATVNTGDQFVQILDHLVCARDLKIRYQDAKDLMRFRDEQLTSLRSRIAALDDDRHKEIAALKEEIDRTKDHHVEDECSTCGVRDCRGGDPLHYHHDGCPYEYGIERQRDHYRKALEEAKESHRSVDDDGVEYCCGCGVTWSNQGHYPGCRVTGIDRALAPQDEKH